MEEKERKLSKKEKFGVSAAIMMFCAIGMMMGGGAAGNLPVSYSGAALFASGAVIGIWLILDSKKNGKDENDDLFEE